jgi:tRNA(Ile)-lysidine synthase
VDTLNFHHLRYFREVAREGGLRRAAEKLRVSQPSISAQIRELEAALGQPLFRRSGRRNVLTDAGRAALGYADQIFALGNQLVKAVKSPPGAPALRLCVRAGDASLPKPAGSAMQASAGETWLAGLERVLLQECQVTTDERLVLAVSGGVDSMVLLRGLSELAPAHAWKLTVAHLNHGLRGRASAADERLVRSEAARLQLPCVVGRARLRGDRQGESLEMAARNARHKFLAHTARSAGAAKILLAHHADDQVEGFLLRLLRGTGVAALGGMLPASPSPADPSMVLLRPLLHFRKAELLEIASRCRVAFREDASNQCTDILRNRVRHVLLPLLRRDYQPGIDATLLRTMRILRDESDCLAEFNALAGQPFAKLPVALQRRRLHSQILALGAEPDFHKIETLRRAPGQAVAFEPSPGSDAPRLLVLNPAGLVGILPPTAPFQRGSLQLDLRKRRGGQLAGVRFSWQFRKSGPSVPLAKPGQEQLDADLVGGSVILRHWQPGDRFQPSGMPRPVKVQDLFTNQKIPRALRRSLVVATTASGELFWVQGLRVSERFKIRLQTIRRLIWRWQTL